MLEIIFNHSHFVAINKPHDLLVHKTPIARDVQVFALQLLRDQLGYEVHPVHRLDRKTGGVLLFAKNRSDISFFSNQFQFGKVQKSYLAIVRGHTEDFGIIDYPLTNDSGKVQEAITHYETLDRSQMDFPSTQHPTSRYSLVQLEPKTGRMHQLRKHMAHILHPIIADRPHGCNKQNKLLKEKFELMTMMLHARKLQFEWRSERVVVEAELQSEFKRMLGVLCLSLNGS